MPDTRVAGGVASPSPHDSAHKHVAGDALYIDDMPEAERTLHLYVAQSARAHAKVTKLDLGAVRTAPGVACVIGVAEIPGINDISPTHRDDEPILADGLVAFMGQALFCVAADSIEQARSAAKLAVVEYEDLPVVMEVDDAHARQDYVFPPMRMKRGDAGPAIAAAQHRLSGRIAIGGQDHFYLEGHISLAVPGEDGDVTVWCSTQHPSECQHMVARALGVASNAVTVEVRRMGGGFGGKETQGHQFACLAAIVAKRTGRAAKLRLDRDDDMTMTGKRHEFWVDYEVGFDTKGVIKGVRMDYLSRCGYSSDLSGPVNDRALFHADNCYFFETVELACYPCKTNTVSATAFRGFGGPQGMVGGERVIEEIAFALGLDPLEVRKRNLYGTTERNVTPYHQTVEDNIAHRVIAELETTSDYWRRREEIRAFNARSPWLKKGLALTPVKFGISFTLTAYNQAGALLHIYADGSLHLNHGGTEMGQGLFVKVAQVVAEELQVDLDLIKITATNTSKVPNTSATAASSGSDLNGMAALAAARTLRERLTNFAAGKLGVAEAAIEWRAGRITGGDKSIGFTELVQAAYGARISLSATGFYATPKIHWDRAAGRGRPFYYFAYGAACAEVTIDTLTGEYRVDRADLLHDVGRSLNPAIDLGQVEGAFIQGMGWLTTEELWWDDEGRLRTHAPSTYKIPCCSDRPKDLRIALMEGVSNHEATVHRSKAVGEPPFMLAISVLHALSDAVASVADHRFCPRLDPPATPERVLAAVEDMRARVSELKVAAE